ncbi:MAG TPA: cytochrome c [bacterium]
MKKTLVLASLVLCGSLASSAGAAAPDPVATLESGRKAFDTVCSKCHKLDLPLSKKLDRPGWEGILGAMTGRGAAFSPEERQLVIDYLVVKSTFETKCATCHATQNALAARRSRAEWEKTVRRMAEKSPGAFTSQEIDLITAYLTLVVGSEK